MSLEDIIRKIVREEIERAMKLSSETTEEAPEVEEDEEEDTPTETTKKKTKKKKAKSAKKKASRKAPPGEEPEDDDSDSDNGVTKVPDSYEGLMANIKEALGNCSDEEAAKKASMKWLKENTEHNKFSEVPVDEYAEVLAGALDVIAAH